MLATLVPRGPSSGHIHHIGTFGHARLLTRHNHFLYLSRDSRIPWSGLAFRPIVFLGFCPKTQKPTTQAGSTFGSIYMRHPRIIDRGRKSIFTPIKSSKIYQFLPKTQKTQKPKTQNPKPKTQNPKTQKPKNPKTQKPKKPKPKCKNKNQKAKYWKVWNYTQQSGSTIPVGRIFASGIGDRT